VFAYILQPVSSQPRGSQKSRRKCGKEKTRYQLKHCVNFFEGDVMKCVGIGVILMSSDFRDQSDRSKDPTTDENFPTSICIRLLPSRLFKIDHTPASIRIR